MSGTEQPYERILAYLKGLLSNRQRHDLERDMMRDVFDEEAFEGLSHLSAGELEADMDVLSNKLDSRIKPGRKNNLRIYYSLAAGIFLLAGIGSILYLILRKPATELITEEMSRTEVDKDTVSSVPAATQESLSVARVESPALEQNRQKTEKKAAGPPPSSVLEITLVQEPVEDEVRVVSYGKKAEQQIAMAAPEKESDSVSGRVKAEQVMQDRKAGPVPPGGSLRYFRKWVYENLDAEALKDFPGEHAVRVDFTVQTDGHIRNVQIRDSLPDVMILELKNTLLRSPTWKPALRDNTPVESQVEVSLIISVK